MITAENITYDQLKALRLAALNKRNALLVGLCDIAMLSFEGTEYYTTLTAVEKAQLRKCSESDALFACAQAFEKFSQEEI